MTIFNTTHKRKSSILTLVILIVFVWGIFSFGMQYQDPPVEYGIVINFGTSNEGNKKPKNTSVKKLPIQENQEERSEETVEDIPEEIKNDEVLSQTDKDAPTIQKPKEDAEPTPKKPSKNTLKAFDDLLKGDTSDGKPTGDSDAAQEGVKGDKNGDPASTKYYGNTGKSGDPNYNLAGREALLKPKEQPNCEEEGIVVVSIEVDKEGKVIRAISGVKGTTNSANCLLKPAREAALKTTWNADPNSPSKQKGTIIYKFSLTK
ncbi:energy transducer TonB [Flavobacteriaceae bacterium]|nr:energy transducer TonB [Flavobacteriaceae bacterium]